VAGEENTRNGVGRFIFLKAIILFLKNIYCKKQAYA